MNSSVVGENCPGRTCFELLGRKWTTQIVWALLTGPRRFTELHAAIPAVSDKTLSSRLRELEEAGILSRAHYPEIPPRVEYTLTSAGLALHGVITEMERWSHEFGKSLARSDSPGSA